MTLGTLVVFASVLYLGGATLFGYRTDGIGWLLVAAASLLPDADLPTSKIGRLCFWLSAPLELGHHGMECRRLSRGRARRHVSLARPRGF